MYQYHYNHIRLSEFFDRKLWRKDWCTDCSRSSSPGGSRKSSAGPPLAETRRGWFSELLTWSGPQSAGRSVCRLWASHCGPRLRKPPCDRTRRMCWNSNWAYLHSCSVSLKNGTVDSLGSRFLRTVQSIRGWGRVWGTNSGTKSASLALWFGSSFAELFNSTRP